MDFDDEDKPKEVARTRRFAPGRAGKTKPKPKPEPPAGKPDQPSSSQTESVSKSEHDVDVKSTGAKVEPPPEVYNGAVKMEIDSKVEKEPEIMETELIVEDQLPLQDERMEEDEEEEEEEEEDVVVREIDVLFNPSIDANNKLYVLQYPLRPSWRPYEMDERCQEVRVNTSTSQVEIDLSMDVHSKNYDSNFGVNMTKQTLKTTWKQPPALDYAVGVLSGDKLHLNPVHAVAQLRPSMHYLSSDGKKKQAEPTEEAVGTSKKQNKEVQASTSTDQKPVNENKWVALTYHGLQSEYCSRYLNGMMANGNSSLDFNMSPDVYINELCRGGSSRNSKSKESSKRFLLSLPLRERVQKLLCEEQGSSLFRYSVLKHYASEFSDADFLEALQEYGWLVQGLWTPKTSLLKLDGSVGASRDYVLCLFSKNTTIKYSEVEATVSLREKMKTILPKFAKERPLLDDWKFKEPTDVSFIKSYPKIVKKQDFILTEKRKELELVIATKGGKRKADNKRNLVGKNSSVTVKPEVPTTLSDKGGSSKNTIPSVRQEMPDDLKRALTKALKKVFQTHKVCSYETICQGLRDLAVSTSNNPKADSGMAVNVALAVDAHQDKLRDFITSEVAVDIYGSFVSKSSPDHPEYDPLREVVIALFCGSPPGTKLMKADVFEAGRRKLQREITNNEYLKVMNDICETNSSRWVLKKAR